MQVHVDRYNLFSYIVCVGRNAQSGISDGNECMAGVGIIPTSCLGIAMLLLDQRLCPNGYFVYIFFTKNSIRGTIL